MKESGTKHEVDSYIQSVIDRLPGHVKLILCGSYITVMTELLEEGNPLFGRFTEIIHLEAFDYFE
jgi:AAA+ ATPase superfamily predicted ATPase